MGGGGGRQNPGVQVAAGVEPRPDQTRYFPSPGKIETLHGSPRAQTSAGKAPCLRLLQPQSRPEEHTHSFCSGGGGNLDVGVHSFDEDPVHGQIPDLVGGRHQPGVEHAGQALRQGGGEGGPLQHPLVRQLVQRLRACVGPWKPTQVEGVER